MSAAGNSTGGASGLWAVVPVKPLSLAKQRLIPVLAHEERKALARAMLLDVLSALMGSPVLAGVLVVTGDAEAAGIARSAGARVLADCWNAGTTVAVTHAARVLAGENRAAMLVVPADVPAITPDDVQAIAAGHGYAGMMLGTNAPLATMAVTLVPAAADAGTNAMVCSPPDVIAFCFGENSFHRHHEAARARGIEPKVLELERVGCDLDRPGDLATFLRQPAATRSHACLEAWGIAARLLQLNSRGVEHVSACAAPTGSLSQL